MEPKRSIRRREKLRPAGNGRWWRRSSWDSPCARSHFASAATHIKASGSAASMRAEMQPPSPSPTLGESSLFFIRLGKGSAAKVVLRLDFAAESSTEKTYVRERVSLFRTGHSSTVSQCFFWRWVCIRVWNMYGRVRQIGLGTWPTLQWGALRHTSRYVSAQVCIGAVEFYAKPS